MSSESRHVDELLAQVNRGDGEAAATLLDLVYDELRAMAAGYLRRERPDHTLQPTALVHEAYLKMVRQRDARWESRGHFIAIAATAMRRILVDHARAHRARRVARDRVAWEADEAMTAVASSVDLVALDRALDALAGVDARKVRVVELRFFVGLTNEQIAEVVGVDERTVKRDWRFARTWLARHLSDE